MVDEAEGGATSQLIIESPDKNPRVAACEADVFTREAICCASIRSRPMSLYCFTS